MADGLPVQWEHGAAPAPLFQVRLACGAVGLKPTRLLFHRIGPNSLNQKLFYFPNRPELYIMKTNILLLQNLPNFAV
jgi:hypothetical protein